MGKYSDYRRQPTQSRMDRYKVHPIWRGIGFAFMILAPILGYFGSLLLLQENSRQGWFRIPSDFLAQGADPYLYVKIGLTLVLTILIFILFQLITFLLYSAFGPSRYGPMDVKPTGYTGKRYKR